VAQEADPGSSFCPYIDAVREDRDLSRPCALRALRMSRSPAERVPLGNDLRAMASDARFPVTGCPGMRG